MSLTHNRLPRGASLSAALFGAWALSSTTLGDGPRLVQLGGSGTAAPAALSADGRVVVGGANIAGIISGGFRWTEQRGLRQVGLSGPAENVAISCDGLTLCGVWESGFSSFAYRWNSRSGLQPLSLPVGMVGTYAHGLSADGTTIVGSVYDMEPRYLPVRWRAMSAPDVLALPRGFTEGDARAISGDDSTIGGWIRAESFREKACIWRRSGVAELLVPADDETASIIASLNDDGTFAAGICFRGYAYNPLSQAFRWSRSRGLTSLGTVGAFESSWAASISGNGARIVGTVYTNLASSKAMLWTRRIGMVDLNTYLPTLGVDLTGWVLDGASAISSDGTAICGTGIHSGQSMGWLVQGLPAWLPVPAARPAACLRLPRAMSGTAADPPSTDSPDDADPDTD